MRRHPCSPPTSFLVKALEALTSSEPFPPSSEVKVIGLNYCFPKKWQPLFA